MTVTIRGVLLEILLTFTKMNAWDIIQSSTMDLRQEWKSVASVLPRRESGTEGMTYFSDS